MDFVVKFGVFCEAGFLVAVTLHMVTRYKYRELWMIAISYSLLVLSSVYALIQEFHPAYSWYTVVKLVAYSLGIIGISLFYRRRS